MMTFRELETVVLERDIPEHGLRRGDVGAIVLVDDAGLLDVEFVRGSGFTQAVVELEPSDVRRAGDDDIHAMRHIDRKPKAT